MSLKTFVITFEILTGQSFDYRKITKMYNIEEKSIKDALKKAINIIEWTSIVETIFELIDQNDESLYGINKIINDFIDKLESSRELNTLHILRQLIAVNIRHFPQLEINYLHKKEEEEEKQFLSFHF